MSLLGAVTGTSLGTLYVKLTADSIDLVKGLGSAVTSVEQSAAVMIKSLEGLALAASTAFITVGVVSVREFAKFDAAMTKSLAIMDDVTAQTRKALETRARDIAKNSTTSAADLAGAYYYLASAGYNAQQSIDALNIVNKFAIAGSLELETAVSRLADAQSALGLKTKDSTKNMENMTRVADVLAKADQIANASIEQFSAALTNKAASALRLANKEVEEGVAVLAAFADQGVKGLYAGEQLYIALRDLQRAATENADVFNLLNIRVFNGKGEMRNMAAVVKDMEVAMTGMSTAEKRMTFELLGFQDRSLSSILSLMGMSDKIKDYQEQLEKAGGTTQKVSDKQMVSFNAQLTITWRLFQDLFISIGEKMAPGLLQLNEALQESMRSTDGWRASLEKVSERAIPTTLNTIHVLKMEISGLIDLMKESDFLQSIYQGRNVGKYRTPGQIAADAHSAHEAMFSTMSQVPSRANFLKAPGTTSTGNIPDSFDSDYLTGLQAEAVSFKKVADAAEEATFNVTNFKKAQETIMNMKMPEGGSIGHLNKFTDPSIRDALTLKDEVKDTQKNIKILQDLGNEKIKMTDEVSKKRLELLEAYNQKARQLQYAEAQIVISAGQTTFDSLATIGEAFAGKQSGLYKTMFAASKAFAIAESTVKIFQGIANAASLPWPLNLAAIASVIAATASIVTSIQSVKLEFAGQRALGGPVEPGKAFLVGERGPELFLPPSSGSIVPNNRLGGGNVKVVVNNYTDATPSVNQRMDGDERVIEVTIRRIAGEIQSGVGSVTKAIESSYRVRRGR